MSFFKKALNLIFAFSLIQTASAQSFTLEFASMMPLSGNNPLTGIGKGGSFGYQTEVMYNVRVRANVEMQFFKGNDNSFVTYGTYYNWPNPDIIYPIDVSVLNLRYTEFSIGYDYFLFRSYPNMYIGPELYVGKSTTNYKRTSEYDNYQDVSLAYAGGIKLHYGAEKKVKNLAFFAEYAATFSAHTPYVEEGSKFINYSLGHQIGIGMRF